MEHVQILRVILALLAVLALLLGLAWTLRRQGWLQTGMNRSAIQILGSRKLGARGSLTIVQVEDQRLVLGITPQHIALLHTLPPLGASSDRPAAPGTDCADIGADLAPSAASSTSHMVDCSSQTALAAATARRSGFARVLARFQDRR